MPVDMTLSQSPEEVLLETLGDIITKHSRQNTSKLHPVNSFVSAALSSNSSQFRGTETSSLRTDNERTVSSMHQGENSSYGSASHQLDSSIASPYPNNNFRVPSAANAPQGLRTDNSGSPARQVPSLISRLLSHGQYHSGHRNGGFVPHLPFPTSSSRRDNEDWPAWMQRTDRRHMLYPADIISQDVSFRSICQNPSMRLPPPCPSHQRNPSHVQFWQEYYHYQQQQQYYHSLPYHRSAQPNQTRPLNWHQSATTNNVNQPHAVLQNSNCDQVQMMSNIPPNLNGTSALACMQPSAACFRLQAPTSQDRNVTQPRQVLSGMKLPTVVGPPTGFNRTLIQESSVTELSELHQNVSKMQQKSTQPALSTNAVWSEQEKSLTRYSPSATSSSIVASSSSSPSPVLFLSSSAAATLSSTEALLSAATAANKFQTSASIPTTPRSSFSSAVVASVPVMRSEIPLYQICRNNPSSSQSNAINASDTCRKHSTERENCQERTQQPLKVKPSIPQESLNRFLYTLYHEDEAPEQEDEAPQKEDEAPEKEDEAPGKEDEAPEKEQDQSEKPAKQHSNKTSENGEYKTYGKYHAIENIKCEYETSEHDSENETLEKENSQSVVLDTHCIVEEDEREEEIKPYLSLGFYSCGSCHLPFNYEFSLLAHLCENHIGDSHITCAHCFKRIEKTAMCLHLSFMHKNVFDKNIIACGGSCQGWRCSFTENSKEEMKKHMILNHKKYCQLYKCVKCKFTSPLIEDYISHWTGGMDTCVPTENSVDGHPVLEEMDINSVCAPIDEIPQDTYIPKNVTFGEKSSNRQDPTNKDVESRSQCKSRNRGKSVINLNSICPHIKKSCGIRNVSADDSPNIADIVSLVDLSDKEKRTESRKTPAPATTHDNGNGKKRKFVEKASERTDIECFICNVHTESREAMEQHYRTEHKEANEMLWIDRSTNKHKNRRKIENDTSRKRKNSWNKRMDDAKRKKVQQNGTNHCQLPCDEMASAFHLMVQRNNDIFDMEDEDEDLSSQPNPITISCGTDEEPCTIGGEPEDGLQDIAFGTNVPLKTMSLIYCCNECPYKGHSRLHFALHLGQHSKFKERLHPIHPTLTKQRCDTCGYCAIDNEDLDQHQGLHLEQKQFVCLCCSEDFTTKDRMRRHLVDFHQIPRELDRFFLDRHALYRRMLKDSPKMSLLDVRVCL